VVPPAERGSAYFDDYVRKGVALWTKVLGGLEPSAKQ
jgi:hypothetical protein